MPHFAIAHVGIKNDDDDSGASCVFFFEPNVKNGQQQEQKTQ
jgi:hypothetical protein